MEKETSTQVADQPLDKIDDLSVSLLGFWVKGKMSVDNDNLHVEMPNTTFWGLIPTGKTPHTIQLASVSDVSVITDTKIGGIILGVLIALSSFGMFQDSAFWGLVLLAVGVLLILSSIKTAFYFNAQGTNWAISVPFFERERLNQFVDQVNKKIANYNADRNTRVHTDRSIKSSNDNTTKIVNAINGSTVKGKQAGETSSNIKAVFCKNCGAKNDADSNFCTSCGKKLN